MTVDFDVSGNQLTGTLPEELPSLGTSCKFGLGIDVFENYISPANTVFLCGSFQTGSRTTISEAPFQAPFAHGEME